jgi:hypothetical protein
MFLDLGKWDILCEEGVFPEEAISSLTGRLLTALHPRCGACVGLAPSQ